MTKKCGVIRTNLWVFFLYILTSLFIFRGIVFSSGIIIGGDWSLPFTLSQMRIYLQNGLYTWSNGSFFGSGQFFLHGLPFYTIVGILAKLGISGRIYLRLFLLMAFVFPAFSMYILGRFLSCDRKVAFMGGVLYLTLPFFFNYAAIGWLLVLFSMGVLPLVVVTFIKSIKESNFTYSILTGFLYFLAIIQPQSLVWTFLALLCLALFLVTDRRTFFTYCQSFLVVILVFLSMNVYWCLPLFLGSGSATLTTKLGLSSISLGTWARLSNLNLLRGWGSLYNYSYETSYIKILRPLSFVLPLLAYSSLLFLRGKRIIYSLVLLSFVPMVLYNLGPNFIANLPFSDFVRDMGRFSVISSFSFVVLAMLVLNYLFGHKQKWLKALGIAFCVLLMINAHSFWLKEISGEQKQMQDIRLRSYQFSQDNLYLENLLNGEDKDVKVLYLPLGGTLNALDDKRFNGAYKEMRDIFATYFPKPGEVGISDKGMGSSSEIIMKMIAIQENRQLNELTKMLNMLGVKYIAVRKNVDSSSKNISGKEIASYLKQKTNLTLTQDWETISVFEKNDYYPHFYIPQKTIYLNGTVDDLFYILTNEKEKYRLGFFLNKTDSAVLRTQKLNIRFDQVFVKGELVNQIDLEEKGKSLEVSLPSIHFKPGSFIYQLLLRIEDFDKWKVRKEPEKLVNKCLFYASKRIAELTSLDADNMEHFNNLIENYKKEMEMAIETTRETREINTYLEMHRKKVETANLDEEIKGKARNRFDYLETIIEKNQPKRNFSDLVYKLSVPMEGEYQIYVNNVNELFDSLPTNDKVFGTGGTKPDIGDVVIDMGEDWQWLGTKNFQKGKQEFALPLRGLSENLIDENLKIRDYQSNAVYVISFDYRAPKGGSFFIAEGKNKETSRTDLVPTGDKFRHFEKYFNSSLGVNEASIHLSISVAEEKNLEVKAVFQPGMLLKKVEVQTSKIDYPIPKITYVKINPTKYKIKIEEAISPYTLIFSESFNPGWKAYINDQRLVTSDLYGETVASYFDGDIKEGTHKNIFLDRNTFETWKKKAIPDENHLLVNGYANSWYITPEDSKGQKDYDIIIEFWPQRLFYAGLCFSLIVLLGCLSYLVFQLLTNKSKKVRMMLQFKRTFPKPRNKT